MQPLRRAHCLPRRLSLRPLLPLKAFRLPLPFPEPPVVRALGQHPCTQHPCSQHWVFPVRVLILFFPCLGIVLPGPSPLPVPRPRHLSRPTFQCRNLRPSSYFF